MTMPSGIYALAQFEVKNSQADFASRVEPFVSKDWIRRNVFHLSDDEIKAIEKGAEKDMQAMGGGAFGADVESDARYALNERVLERHRGEFATKAEIRKILDEQRRLEDIRRRESDRRHEELLERMNTVLTTNHAFAKRVQRSAEFASLVRDGGVSRGRNGNVQTTPTAAPRSIRFDG